MTWKSLSIVSLFIFLTGATLAHADDRNDARRNGRFTPQAMAHSGSSPFDPQPATDTLVVSDNGTGLDTGCTFRNGGPLLIDINVKRVVGTVDANGQLLDAGALKSGGFLSNTAKITFPAFDIDQPAEVDHVYFNGHFLGTVQGADSQWVLNTFTVPIEWVKFGRAAAGFNMEGLNKLEIRIDQASGSAENWCMSVDWVQLQFDAIAPIFMVHGIAAQSSTWFGMPNPIPDYYASLGIPHSHNINLDPNGSPQLNGFLLSQRLNQLANEFGTKRCHLIVHSKGGNDSREYLAKYNNPTQLKILSLHTLSTSFKGSVLAEIIHMARTNPTATSSDPVLQQIVEDDLPMLDGFTYKVPCCAALESLRPLDMAAFNLATPFPPSMKFYNYGADADLNDDGNIASSENQVYPTVLWVGGGTSMANAAYKTLDSIMRVKLVSQPVLDGTGYPVATILKIEPDVTLSPLGSNDLAVTTWSAQHPNGVYLGQIDANHTTMKSKIIGQGIISRIKADFPVTP